MNSSKNSYFLENESEKAEAIKKILNIIASTLSTLSFVKNIIKKKTIKISVYVEEMLEEQHSSGYKGRHLVVPSLTAGLFMNDK